MRKTSTSVDLLISPRIGDKIHFTHHQNNWLLICLFSWLVWTPFLTIFFIQMQKKRCATSEKISPNCTQEGTLKDLSLTNGALSINT
jgi:hypothetical protein